MKNNRIFQNMNNLVRREALIYIFANLIFGIWLGKRELDSQICFFIQSVAVSQPLESSKAHLSTKCSVHLRKIEGENGK